MQGEETCNSKLAIKKVTEHEKKVKQIKFIIKREAYRTKEKSKGEKHTR